MSKQAELKRICQNIDSRLKKNKDGLVSFADSKGYETYAEYIYTEYQTRTAQSLIDEMKEYVKPHSVDSIWAIVARIKRELKEFEFGIRHQNKSNNVKICYECKENTVPPENHALCLSCDAKRILKITRGGYSETVRHNTGYNYHF